MNEHELSLGLGAIHQERADVADVEAVRQHVLAASIQGMPQQRSWLSRIDTRGFDMFSALKFVAAAAIVALFGGFVLAGVLTMPQGEEMAPAAVSASPSPQTEQAEATQPPDSEPVPMTTDELLSGMLTEEVEPGVLRVLNHGVPDLAAFDPDLAEDRWGPTIAAGADGSVWLFGPSRFLRLGDEQAYSWPFGSMTDLDITPDGRLWVGSWTWIDDGLGQYEGVHVFDGDAPEGQRWSLQRSPDGHDIFNVEVASDGTVWAAWADADGEASIGGLNDDGWHVLDGDAPDRVDDVLGAGRLSWYGQLLVGDDGVIRANVLGQPGFGLGDPDGPDPLYRYDSGEWREEEPPGEGWIAVGPDGILWLWYQTWYGSQVARFDGTDWQTWGPRDGTPRELVPGPFPTGAVTPDGTLWSASDSGLYSFDGTTWKRYMPGLVASAIEITPDGSVWVQGRGRHAGLNTYVIRPEAAAATE